MYWISVFKIQLELDVAVLAAWSQGWFLEETYY